MRAREPARIVRSASGLAVKSFTIRRIDATALLKSRLASDTALEMSDRPECAAHLALPCRVGKSIREEAPDGNERQNHNPCADRKRGKYPGKTIEWKREVEARHGAVRSRQWPELTSPEVLM